MTRLYSLSLVMQVLMGMGPQISKQLELVSFHTVSKGFLGECGQRGGYFEMTNFHPQVLSTSQKLLLNDFLQFF